MDIENIKTKLKAGIYVLLTIIVGIILVRVLLKLLGANEDSQFALFWYDLSQYFVGPFENIYPIIAPSSSKLIFETHSIIAVLVYALLTGMFAKSLTSIGDSSKILKVKEILDLFFKVSEFFLGFRFLLKITGASEMAGFVRFINSASAIVYEPFADLLPTRIFGSEDQFILEVSTLIALIVMIIFDVLSDVLISTLNKSPITQVISPKSPDTIKVSGNPISQMPYFDPSHTTQPAVTPSPFTGSNQAQQNPQPYTPQPTQSFNFNIGQPQPPAPVSEPQSYVDQRSVNVYPPSPAGSNSQNQLLTDSTTPAKLDTDIHNRLNPSESEGTSPLQPFP